MNILIIEDNTSLATLLNMLLASEGMTTTLCHDGLEASKRIEKEEFDVMVTDIRLPGLTGLELFALARKLRPEMPVIIMTAHGTIPDAVQAIRDGAYDYITKPFENDAFVHIIKNALELRQIRRENSELKQYVKSSIRPDMTGDSAAFRAALSLADTVAPTDAPVLVTGESGTGKELIARHLHSKSPRAGRQFIAVNCGAIPENLIESELFGHKKGSFTGADKDAKGKIAEADGGTLFLDEIGEMPLAAQVKLLRFLQEGEVQPVGASMPVKVNARIVAATNRDLKDFAAKGRFREDLFYRLNVFPLEMPPLRNRREDIPALVSHFSRKYGAKGLRFPDNVMQKLVQYRWPGNIRELENVIYRLSILVKDGDAPMSLLPQEISPDPLACLNLHLPDEGIDLEELEKSLVLRALERCSGNKSKAAEYLKIPRHVLLYRLEKYGIDR